MFNFCPFISQLSEKGTRKTSNCEQSCALNVNGKCAFYLMGLKAQKDISFDKDSCKSQ